MDKPRHTRYRAVFISPHLDDAVFSCGGVISKLVEEGPVLVLNLFTRYLSGLKLHGAVLGDDRHQEEVDAAEFLGFESFSLHELDAPFRRDAYQRLGNLFRPPVAQDMEWLSTLREKLFALLGELDFEQIYVPLGIGWHVDHVLAHLVFEPWMDRKNLLFYEDAPYCCIPHSTRYRLNGIAHYEGGLTDLSLAPSNALNAWRQAARAYGQTALMKNLQPWIVRQLAVPAVSIYLYRLMARYRNQVTMVPELTLEPLVVQIADRLGKKIEAMALYSSQFNEFFASRQDCVATLQAYAGRVQGKTEAAAIERYWVPVTTSSRIDRYELPV